ncbi:hypothetical protein ACOSQ2_016639 [Xanthoceras sorbifolium]
MGVETPNEPHSFFTGKAASSQAKGLFPVTLFLFGPATPVFASRATLFQFLFFDNLESLGLGKLDSSPQTNPPKTKLASAYDSEEGGSMSASRIFPIFRGSNIKDRQGTIAAVIMGKE